MRGLAIQLTPAQTLGAEHNPKLYPLGASAHDGEDLWTKLVSRPDHLHWVQSGHHVGGHIAYRRHVSHGGMGLFIRFLKIGVVSL